MKWFHHECAAKHNPKLQTLGDRFGAEGLGTYWGLLEEIGQHSDTFHLKVTGLSEETDRIFEDISKEPAKPIEDMFGKHVSVQSIPQLSLKILARNLFTTQKKLKQILDALVSFGLFDSAKWLKYNVLYSPSFELRADDYTRRQQRKAGQTTNTMRIEFPQPSSEVRRGSDGVPPEQTTEQEREEEQKSIQACMPDENPVSTGYPQQGEFLIDPSAEQLTQYANAVRLTLRNWNASHENPFAWQPTDAELAKLFCSGSKKHKVAMCYQAYNLNNGQINYPELVLRAVRLMLKSSEKKRIQNPTGWVWSCLHGTGDGTTPWVQLLTADEENSVGHHLGRLISSRSNHPP